MSLRTSKFIALEGHCHQPQLAIELREKHTEVTTAYHFNKQHWNGVDIYGSISNNRLKEWIDLSYTIVFDSLPKSKRETFQ